MSPTPESHAEQDLAGRSFRQRDLRASNFAGAILRHADFKDSVCRAANFAVAILSFANFEGADLRGANLTGADLRGASFKGADLRGAHLLAARTDGADFTDARLEGASNVNDGGYRVPWRDDPLSDVECDLIEALFDGHFEIATGINPSFVALWNAFETHGDYFAALAAALASIGGKHAPIAEIAEFLENSAGAPVLASAESNARIPGWGNSFEKGAPVKCMQPVDRLLVHVAPRLHQTIVSVTEALHGRGKRIYPNPGCYTAAVALALRCPPALAPFLFVQARLRPWTEALAAMLKQEKKPYAVPNP